MPKILVVDDHHDTRALLVGILFDAGYDVTEAGNGAMALEQASKERPDLILMDVSMPVMDGFEALVKLREDPATENIPVVMLTVMPAKKGELAAFKLRAHHYITKPFSPRHIQLAVKVALREAGNSGRDAEEDDQSRVWRGSSADQKTPSGSEDQKLIKTGSQALNNILNGGLPPGSLTLIEGTASTGKSVLCQHIAHESLQDGFGVAYLTSDKTARGLVAQMRSLGMDVAKYLRSDRLRVNPLVQGFLGDDPDCEYNPADLMGALTGEVERLAKTQEVIILDDMTDLATESEERTIMRFFSACKRLATKGSAIIVVVQSHAFDGKTRSRLRDVSDAHFTLRTEKMGVMMGTTLEVLKANGAEMRLGNSVSFRVQSDVGINILPVGKVKV